MYFVEYSDISKAQMAATPFERRRRPITITPNNSRGSMAVWLRAGWTS
jgi:hypothetical protein